MANEIFIVKIFEQFIDVIERKKEIQGVKGGQDVRRGSEAAASGDGYGVWRSLICTVHLEHVWHELQPNTRRIMRKNIMK